MINSGWRWEAKALERTRDGGQRIMKGGGGQKRPPRLTFEQVVLAWVGGFATNGSDEQWQVTKGGRHGEVGDVAPCHVERVTCRPPCHAELSITRTSLNVEMFSEGGQIRSVHINVVSHKICTLWGIVLLIALENEHSSSFLRVMGGALRWWWWWEGKRAPHFKANGYFCW